MKTIYKDGNWERVDEVTAKLRVGSQGWKLVPKSEWKQNVRDVNKAKEEEKKKDTQNKKDIKIKKS